MPSERRPHLANFAHAIAAAAGAWDSAKFHAILARRYANTDEATADALYAEGYARERLGDVRLAAACYRLAVLLAGHRQAARRLQVLSLHRVFEGVDGNGTLP